VRTDHDSLRNKAEDHADHTVGPGGRHEGRSL
jgi:hypothetical protein